MWSTLLNSPWNQIDTYLHRNTAAKLSHGCCPECAAKAFIDFGFAIPERIQAELAAHNYEEGDQTRKVLRLGGTQSGLRVGCAIHGAAPPRLI